MGIIDPKRAAGGRSDALRTKREVWSTYLSNRSPQVLLTGLAIVVAIRLVIGDWTGADLLMVGLTAVLIGPVEWVLHLVLLHAPDDSFRMRSLKTGAGHRQHHLDPHDIGWILLTGADAATFQMMIAVWTATWSLPVLWLTGSALLAPYLTALTAAYLSLAHYEWVHLLVHTRYRPRTRYYRRLAANHRLHHYRNERYWLGVTSNLGDRVLRTYPKHKADVPLSDTARTLA